MDIYKIILQIITAVFQGVQLNESYTIHSRNQSGPNAAKIKHICYGICRNYYTLSYIIHKLVSKKNKNKDLTNILFMGIYELKYTQKHSYAVVNDLVNFTSEITPILAHKNFINAVLRQYLRQPPQLSPDTHPEIKYNLPQWMMQQLQLQYPDTCAAIMHNLQDLPLMALRINPNKITLSEYTDLLNHHNIEFKLVENKIILLKRITMQQLPFFADGYVSVQDISAQKLLELVTFKPTDYVLDACCAPGGKLCAMVEAYQSLKVLGCDIKPQRLELVRQNLVRLNLSADLIQADVTLDNWWDKHKFDVIIADVPCSASGTIKRNPDIAINRTMREVQDIVVQQRKIVVNLWKMLQPKGRLIYITCSIFQQENQENIDFFVQTLKSCCLVKQLQILPTSEADGFYYAILENTNN